MARTFRSFAWGLVAGVVLVAGLALYVRYRNVLWPVAIKGITDNPRAYDGKIVLIQGRVEQPIAIGSYGGYTVQDDTGSILVITDAGTPERGSAVRVRGMVKQAFAIGNAKLLVLVEKRS